MGIDHFMWGYQPHFRVDVESVAKSVLGALDPDLHPEVFVVGVLPKDDPGKYPACVEPENDCWIQSEAFNGVVEAAIPIRAAYPEAQIFQSLAIAQQRQDDALYRRSIRDAILEVVNAHPDKPEDTTFFASPPVSVQGYLVAVVLGVRTSALERNHQFSSGLIPMHEYRNFSVVRSLVDAAIVGVLGEAVGVLHLPDPGLWTIERRTDELVREAGRRLANDTSFRTEPRALDGMHGFFDSICSISSLRYELAEGHGKLVVAREDHPGIQRRLGFSGTIHLRDHRRARKLLELASKGSALHINCDCIFGVVEGTEPEPSAEDLFTVRIVGHHHWELAHGPDVMMGVKYGQPYLPKPAAYRLKLLHDLPRLFPGISADATSLLVSLVSQAERERHGTLLVISAHAAAEAERLRSQGTPVEPFPLTPKLLEDLTGIDGAVLVDPTGQCYAIGVILDGLATNEGDPARGARFNSAVRYVKSAFGREISTLAVVVSEDGGVTLVPDLRP